MISKGIVGEGKVMVTEENTAARMGSGTLRVFATPAMILLVERTASESLLPFLQGGESTVGTSLDIKHTAASAVGEEVFCRTEVTDVERSKIIFSVKVWDKAGEIGSGRHERFLINNEKFMARVSSRAESK